MRPLLVLLLVLAAVGALLFTIFKITGNPTETPAFDPDIELTDSPDGSNAAPDTSADLVGGNDRDPVRTQPAEDRTGIETSGAATGNSLSGTVSSADGALAGVRVSLTRSTPEASFFSSVLDTSEDVIVETDAQGRYLFRDVEPFDHYGVVARHPDYGRALLSPVSVGETGDFTAQPIIMKAGYTLSGVVTDETGQGIAGATLTLNSRMFLNPGEVDPDSVATTSEAGGAYEFKNVSPMVHKHLMATAQGFEKKSHTGFDVAKEPTLNVRLKTAEMIGGNVYGPGDVPIPGARVMAMSTPTTNRATTDQVLSDDNGHFELTGLSSGVYSLSFSATGYKQQALQRIEAGDMSVTVRLVPRAIVSGRVLDDAGNPVTKGSVRARRVQESSSITSPTQFKTTFESALGKYELGDLPKGTYVIEGTAEGFAPTPSQQFTVVEGQQIPGIDINLKRGGEIRGRVVDAGGSPVRGARVTTHDKTWSDDAFTRALADMFPTNATSRTARTGSDGTFVLKGLSPDSYQVRVRASGYADSVNVPIEVREGAPKDMGSIVMARGGTVSGQVFDGNRKIVVGAEVRLTMTAVQPGSPPVHQEARTGSDGRFVFGNVVAGQYKLRASRRPGDQTGGFPGANAANPLALELAIEDVTVTEGENLKRDLTLSR